MISRSITVDPGKIAAKISFYRGEIVRLNGLLESLEEFEVDDSAKNGRGRPRKANSALEKIREFVLAQAGDFTSSQIRESIGSTRKGLFRDAIDELVEKKVLEVVETAAGRRPAKYRKVEAK